jgi:RimJ/RimL family protein N-acetyltransferase
MVSLREFDESDAAALRAGQYPGAETEDIGAMIRDWREKTYQGKYFEMLAVTDDGRVVGSVSLYERSANIASAGIEIFPAERRKGYAEEAMRLILERAAGRGFRAVQDQVAGDNAASIALHEKTGFETDGYIYTNARGREVMLYTAFL